MFWVGSVLEKKPLQNQNCLKLLLWFESHTRQMDVWCFDAFGPVWSESSLSAWRKLGSLATHWVCSEDSDQIVRMPRLIWVLAGCTGYIVGFVMKWLIWSLHVFQQWSYIRTMDWWLWSIITIMILSFRTDRPWQTVQTQIRLLLEVQSDQGLWLFAIPSASFGCITLN